MPLNRLQETILYTLAKAHDKGINNLSKFQLMKLVYMIEINSQRFLGESFIHNVKFYREKNGPISYDIYKAVDELTKTGFIEAWAEDNTEYGHPRHCHRIKKQPAQVSFGKSEKVFLNSILEDYLPLTIAKLKAEAYKTEPMQKAQQEEKRQGHPLNGRPLDLDTVALDEDILSAILG